LKRAGDPLQPRPSIFTKENIRPAGLADANFMGRNAHATRGQVNERPRPSGRADRKICQTKLDAELQRKIESLLVKD